MPLNISVDISSAKLALAGLFPRIEKEVLNALDESATLVSNSAKEGHPKVADRISGEMADNFRVRNLAATGEYAGTYRFLTRTGLARQSIIPIKATIGAGGPVSRVVSGIEYSNDLEFGTVNRRAFPFMRPALEQNRAEIRKRITAAVKRGAEG